MGTWGYKPWDSDDAADFFRAVFEAIDIDAHIDGALRYDDTFGQIRGAAYLLRVLGHSPYVWPGDPDRRIAHIEHALARLKALIDPDGETGYLGGWDDKERAEMEVTTEIAALEALLREHSE